MEWHTRGATAFLVLAVSAVGCQPRDVSPAAGEMAVRAQVDSVMRAYLAAVTRHNANEIVAYYTNSADFRVLANGESLDYPTWAQIQRTSYATVLEVRGGFTDLRTTPLGPAAALVSGRRDQTTIDSGGHGVRRRGAASWIWVMRDGRWLISHINTHYTEEPAK